MADRIKDAWDEVGDGFADLGRRLSEHYNKLGPDPSASVDEEKVREAIRLLTDQVERAFTSLGDTLRDPGAKKGIDRVGQVVRERARDHLLGGGRRDPHTPQGRVGAPRSPGPRVDLSVVSFQCFRIARARRLER